MGKWKVYLVGGFWMLKFKIPRLTVMDDVTFEFSDMVSLHKKND